MAPIEFIKNSKTAYTHAGMFHADDLLASAMLRCVNPSLEIIRIHDDMPIDTDKNLVFDIGEGRYDHHCTPLKTRENGIPYAAFGLLFKDMANLFFKNRDHAALYDAAFVSECDRCDNMPDTNILEISLKLFNPTWDENAKPDDAFEKAVKLLKPLFLVSATSFDLTPRIPHTDPRLEDLINHALANLCVKKYGKKRLDEKDMSRYDKLKSLSFDPDEISHFLLLFSKSYGTFKTNPYLMLTSAASPSDSIAFMEAIIDRKLTHQRAVKKAEKELEKIYETMQDPEILILDRFMPTRTFTDKERAIRYVVYPSERGGVCVSCTPMGKEERGERGIRKFTYRTMFSESLRGRDFIGREDGLMFVHSSGHLAVFKSAEDAVKFLQK